MSQYDPRISLHQIIENIEKAESMTQDMTYDQFVTDWRTRLAAERLIEIIGEAANRLPIELQDRHPEIPWRQMIGTRNWLAHGYDAIDYQIIWDVLTKHLSFVNSQAQQILAELDEQV